MERVLWPRCACGGSTKNVAGCVAVVVVIVNAQLRFKSRCICLLLYLLVVVVVISTVCARLSLSVSELYGSQLH